MRLLAVADLHGRTKRLEAVARQVAAIRPQAVVVAGDIAAGRRLEASLDRLARLGPPVYLVRGNCEGRGFERLVQARPRLSALSSTPLQIGDAYLTGLGGTLPLPFASRICWREAALLESLSPAPRPHILVVHPPPYGLLDEVLGGLHTGSRGLAHWIGRYQPDLVLCGHIHEGAGSAALGATTVVNCAVGRRGGGALIDVAGARPQIELLPPVV